MKSAVFSVLFSALVVCADKTNPISFKTRTNVVPNQFIVEVEATSNLRRRFGDLHPLDAVYHELRSRAVHMQVTNEFKMDGVFNGATVVVNNAEHLSLIKNTPGVKAVRPIRIFSRPKPTKLHIIPLAEGPEIPDGLSSHILAGVDKVHAEGNTGKGVKIGIIDSGVDYNHPALGNGFGPDKKFAFGYDFVGDNFNGTAPNPQPKPDPMDCFGHGTHVAGILAAEPGNQLNISGVAYGATFGAYKVFGCDGDTTDEILIQALFRSAKDGMDILTLSLGDPSGWSSSSTAVVANALANNGTIITVAAGNDGSDGSWDASSPASGKDIIAVGSVDNTVVLYQNATVQGAEYPPITYASSLPLNINDSLPIFATSTNTAVTDDACSPLTNAPDLSKHLVIIKSGNCTLVTKVNNAVAKGARAMFFYKNGTGFPSFNFRNVTAAFIRAADAEFLVKQFAAGAQVSVSFPQVGSSTKVQDPNGGLMSAFSSYGPSFEFEFKPSFSAPGGNILSTYPTAMGGYAILSGTSMATPFVAGGVALLLAANKSLDLKNVNVAKMLLETTSTMIIASNNNSNSGFDTLSKAGAGLMNVYKAIHSTTLISPGELILNDTAHFRGKNIIMVQNTGNDAKDYTLKHVPALTAMTMQNNSLPAPGPVPLVPTFATVEINPPTFTLQPGKNQEVVVTVIPPTGLDNSLCPVYSGFVEVTSGSETWHSSYIGLAANLKDLKVFDTTTSVVKYPSPSILRVNGPDLIDLILQPTNFTFTGADFPTIFLRLAVGVARIYVDLVRADFQMPNPPGLFSDVKVIGSIDSDTYVGRNDVSVYPFVTIKLSKPQFQDRSTIPNGQYCILIRALKLTGDPNLGGDYESWLSPIIGINAR